MITLVHILGRTTCGLLVVAALSAPAYAQTLSSWVLGGANGIPWAAAAERWIALDDTTRPGALQPQEIPPGRTVTRQLLRTGIATTQRNIFDYRWSLHKGPRQIEADTLEVGWHPRLWVGGGANAQATEVMRGLVDGDELTAAFSHSGTFDGRLNGVRFITLDLGVPVPIDSIVFFPPQTGLTSDNERQRDLFARAYEISRTNVPLEWLIFEDETTSTGSSGYHALEEIIGSTFANNNSIVSLTPELRFTRFVRFKFGEVTTTTLLAELQLFGRGYPQQARYISAVHSFGEPVSLGRVSWKFTRYRQTPGGQIIADPTAPVQLNLQTRAGFDAEPQTFFLFDDLGRPAEVDRDTYFDAPRVVERFSEGIAGFRAKRADDTQNWNNWSVSYQASGDEIRSSDGGQYLQFRFDITTQDPLAFGVLDSLAFEVSPLLADSVLAEVSLDGVQETPQSATVEVPLGLDQAFVYDIRTVAGSGRSGFDGIELDVPSAARFVELEIDGVLASEGTDFSFAPGNGRFRFTFPAVIQQNRTFRIRFQSAIFQSSVFLEGRVFNTNAEATLPQSIEAGDARADVPSNRLQVVASDTKLKIFGKVDLSTRVITPNNDNANEQTTIGFDLFGVNGGQLTVGIYDLAGRRVATVLKTAAVAGPYTPVWDGKNDQGQRVTPGLYLVRLEVDVDDGIHNTIESVAVAY